MAPTARRLTDGGGRTLPATRSHGRRNHGAAARGKSPAIPASLTRTASKRAPADVPVRAAAPVRKSATALPGSAKAPAKTLKAAPALKSAPPRSLRAAAVTGKATSRTSVGVPVRTPTKVHAPGVIRRQRSTVGPVSAQRPVGEHAGVQPAMRRSPAAQPGGLKMPDINLPKFLGEVQDNIRGAIPSTSFGVGQTRNAMNAGYSPNNPLKKMRSGR